MANNHEPEEFPCYVDGCLMLLRPSPIMIVQHLLMHAQNYHRMPKVKDIQEFICTVCFYDHDQPVSLASCMHRFCFDCLLQYYDSDADEITCPTCETICDTNSLIYNDPLYNIRLEVFKRENRNFNRLIKNHVIGQREAIIRDLAELEKQRQKYRILDAAQEAIIADYKQNLPRIVGLLDRNRVRSVQRSNRAKLDQFEMNANPISEKAIQQIVARVIQSLNPSEYIRIPRN